MGEKNTVDVLFKRDTLENIRSTPLKDGQVLWTIDQEGNDKIYNDVRQSDDTIKRTQIGGTIQVDQDFDKESPYPLANKKIVNGLKDFIPAYAKDLDILTDALSISTTDENFELNKTQLVVRGTTTNIPEDCRDGVREVGRTKNYTTYVRIFGRDTYGVSTEWFNSWNGTSWLGWARVVTRNDLYIGYDSLINNIQKSVKVFKPTLETEDELAFGIYKNNVAKAIITYVGTAFVHNLAIKKDDGTDTLVIDNNSNLYGSNITCYNDIKAPYIYVTNALSTYNLTTTGIITCNNISVAGNSSIFNDTSTGNSLMLYSNATIRLSASSASGLTLYNDEGGGVFQPDVANVLKLGTTNHSWESIYCAGTIYYGALSQVSDKKAKTHIAYLKDENKLDEFYMNLKPVEYKWKDNGHRTHLGFYAQDIAENAKNTIGDLSMYQARQVEVDEKGRDIEKPYSVDIAEKDLKWTLSYDELIAPTVAMVQKQQKEIEELKQQIENLKR